MESDPTNAHRKNTADMAVFLLFGFFAFAEDTDHFSG